MNIFKVAKNFSQNLTTYITWVTFSMSALFLYFYRLSSLIPGADSIEQATITSVETLGMPFKNPINWPFYALSKLGTVFGISELFCARVLAVILSLGSILLFYNLLRDWLQSSGKAITGTVLFAVSSWGLILGRGAHPVTLAIFLILALLVLGTRILYTTKPFIDWMLIVVCSSIALYCPLLIWIVAAAALTYFVQYKSKAKYQLSHLKQWQIGTIAATIVIVLVPLAISMAGNISHASTILAGGPVAESIPSVVTNLSALLQALFFSNSIESFVGLGSLPLFDVFSLFMFLLGVYYFERRLGLRRSKLMLLGLGLGLVICSLSTPSLNTAGILLPMLYIFIAAGMHESMQRWLAVFPRNPFARSTGIIAISVAVSFVSVYHLGKYFIARPGNPDVVLQYVLK